MLKTKDFKSFNDINRSLTVIKWGPILERKQILEILLLSTGPLKAPYNAVPGSG